MPNMCNRNYIESKMRLVFFVFILNVLGPVSCSLLSGYERLLSAKKVTIDNVAFHVPYLDSAHRPRAYVYSTTT